MTARVSNPEGEMKMETREMIQLMQAMRSTGTRILEYARADETLRLEQTEQWQEPAAGPVLTGAPAQVAGSLNADSLTGTSETIPSPVVGIFYASPAPESDPFVRVGTSVEAGQTICIIEAMKLMNEVASPRSGVVLEVLAENGNRVEFGQPLFRIGALPAADAGADQASAELTGGPDDT